MTLEAGKQALNLNGAGKSSRGSMRVGGQGHARTGSEEVMQL